MIVQNQSNRRTLARPATRQRLKTGVIVVIFGLALTASKGLVRHAVERSSVFAASHISAPAAPGAVPAMHAERASSAAAFIDSIGVQTHISYVDTPYADWQHVIEKLVELRVRHVRDALPLNPAFVKHHQQLLAAGIRCTCGFGMEKPVSAEEIIQSARAAGDVEALEAPNECDAGTNCGGGGKIGIAHVAGILPALSQAAHTLRLPLIAPSFTTREAYATPGSLTQWITYNNLHIYFGGRNPGTEGWGAGDASGHRYGSIDWWLDQSELDAAGAPKIVTETGYEAFDRPTRAGTIPVDVESTYMLRTLLLAWSHGVKRTFVYELLDEFPGSGYGLLRHDLSEKPAFTALKNLINILGDSPPSSAPRELTYAMDGDDRSLSHALFQKTDGSYDLILWLEQSGYDDASQHKIVVAPSPVHLQFGPRTGVRKLVSFHADGSTTSQEFATTRQFITVPVDDHLQVLHIVSN